MSRITLLLFLFFIFSFVSSQSVIKLPTDSRICTSTEKLPGLCYFLYKPVCGVYVNSLGQQIKQTFTNRCFACRNANVQYVYEGSCSSFPSTCKFCIPHPLISIYCITLYQPVCGYFNHNINCLVAPCAQTYTNGCFACLNNKVDCFVSGVCPKKQIYPNNKN